MSHICLKEASVRFNIRGQGPLDVLKGVNLEIQEGEFVSVIGHSGCGKSTMLNVVAGFVPLHEGSATVAGKQVRKPGPDRMMVFQSHALLPWMTVRENIAMAAKAVHAGLSASERVAEVDEHLRLVGLEHAADKRPDEISGGMKQRAGIARALITKPDVLLMDEPFGALDALTRGHLQEKLLEIWEEHRITVMLITHDVDEAILLSDRVVMMSNGPEANVAEILDIDLPRPRERMAAVNHPHYYRYRNHLVRFLRDNKHANTKAEAPEDPDLIRLGFIPLSDCAPILVADEKGLFAKYGLNVEISREPSWASVQKGLLEGRLHASMMLAPMAMAHNLKDGTGEERFLSTSMVLSRNGNGITLSRKLWDEGVRDLADLKAFIDQLGIDERLTLGVVYESSTHNLLLREWLRKGGIDPDVDVELVVIPPPQMIANLDLGNLDGCCVGEPWNSLAAHHGLGAIVESSLSLRSGHPEKLLGCLEQWQEANHETVVRLTAALLEASEICQAPEQRDSIIELLASRKVINVDPACMRDTLHDGLNRTGSGDRERARGFHLFGTGDFARLQRDDVIWLLEGLQQAGILPLDVAVDTARGTFASDLLEEAFALCAPCPDAPATLEMENETEAPVLEELCS